MVKGITDVLQAIIKALNDIDHVWIVVFLFILMLGVWVATKAPFLEKGMSELTTAILTLLVSGGVKTLTNNAVNQTLAVEEIKKE